MFYLGFQELFLVKLAFNGNDKQNNNRQRQGNGEHYLPRQNPKENGVGKRLAVAVKTVKGSRIATKMPFAAKFRLIFSPRLRKNILLGQMNQLAVGKSQCIFHLNFQNRLNMNIALV